MFKGNAESVSTGFGKSLKKDGPNWENSLMMLNKKQLSEEDIKRLFITPALEKAGWIRDRIRMETRITDGKICLRGNLTSRGKPKKADYVLCRGPEQLVAIVEAKSNQYAVSHGLQQAMTYAQMMDVPFAYSSNGDAFQEHDFLTGREREIPLDEFPSPDELLARYEKNAHGGEGLNEAEKRIQNQPYYTSQKTHAPRYYQRNAVNRVVEAVARGQKRLLLVMATGTGKTYTAFQIAYRLLKSGMKRKILYLVDRNNLADQSIQQDFAPLEKTIHKVNFAKDDPASITSYEVYFSLYQQLADRDDEVENSDEEETLHRLAKLFKPDFFDLVIVDECHRGSAKKDSNWRRILEYFESATQIGMTATPKETKYISNIDYFGDPIYTYSLRSGIEDGFLAPFKVINVHTNIGEGWRPFKGQLDKNGREIPDRIYTSSDYDYNIVIEDRIDEVAKKITGYLKTTGRMQKTIVFCANEEHAERMRVALGNLNADMVKENPDYVVRITGSDTYGKSKLDYFISVSSPYPVIATTSKLLSTGADCKMTKLIVLDQMIGSMTEFKQIIGRGTRIREREGKLSFTVMDFRNVTRLFADPDWDGPVEQDEDFGKGEPGGGKDDGHGEDGEKGGETELPPDTGKEPGKKYIVDEDGCSVEIVQETVSIYDAHGKLLRQENIIDYTRKNILGKYASLDRFIACWNELQKKKAIQDQLLEHGIDLDALKADLHMSDVDDFDFICHLAFDQKPLTRRERADNVKKRDFLSRYKGEARAVLEALLERYMNVGISELEGTTVLKLDSFSNFGKPAKIVQLFGGKEGYFRAVRELEEAIYTDEAV